MARRYPEYAVTGTLASSADFNDMVIDGLILLLGMRLGGQTIHTVDEAREIGWHVGDLKISARNADMGSAWLLADGRTVGSANSSATARANADMLGLFTHLWTEFSNAELVIQDSAGNPTTRGASAAIDFAADKRMPLPDLRGRVVAGMDEPNTSTAANRVTAAQADVLGGATGAETHTLTTAQLASHTHQPGLSAVQFLTTVASGGSGAVPLTGGTPNTTQFPGNTSATGSGNAHANVQPTFFANYFIYTGL